jgi:hypothetical protein
MLITKKGYQNSQGKSKGKRGMHWMRKMHRRLYRGSHPHRVRKDSYSHIFEVTGCDRRNWRALDVLFFWKTWRRIIQSIIIVVAAVGLIAWFFSFLKIKKL